VKGWGIVFESVYVLYGMLCQDGSRVGFLAGAPVKVSRGVVVDMYLQVWVVHL
jgi:hypothetical protein